MAKKKKRAPGGGRPPKGDFSKLAKPFSIRMPPEMRSQLKMAADASGRSENQELLRRVRNSFHEDRDKARDPAMRALCYLVAEIGNEMNMAGPDGERISYWLTDRFAFCAFKLAVDELLNSLEPKGKIKAPKMGRTEAENGLWCWDERTKSFQSPEDRAKFVFKYLRWSLLHNESQFDWLDGFPKDLKTSIERRFYGMEDARRDLGIMQRGDKA